MVLKIKVYDSIIIRKHAKWSGIILLKSKVATLMPPSVARPVSLSIHLLSRPAQRTTEQHSL